MSFPAGWQNPIILQPGEIQHEVNPVLLLPSRADLQKMRLELQRQLLDSGVGRFSPIQVNQDGIIWDGHHAVRAAAEKEALVEVSIVAQELKPSWLFILDLPVR